MKSQVLKSLIKEAVKEAIQEELKEVLLEAVRAPRQTVSESLPKISQSQPSQPINEDRRAKYADILGETASSFTSADVKPRFNPQGTMPGGDLPPGELGMDQIMGLISKK